MVLAAVLLAVGGSLRGPLGEQATEHELYVESTGQADSLLIPILPGGLRALAFNYVWIQSQEKHQAGRHYDAKQLAELACQLMPSFPGVWSFHAWNMAWNISVTTHTAEERWHWVSQGMEMLRDQAIPRNRKALILYKELGWVFFFKMGQTMDEFHWTYKKRWASEMQHLLGAPAFGDTPEVIEGFRPVAEAPVDKTLRRQGDWTIQPEQRDALLADEAVGEYAAALAAFDIKIDRSLLSAYNRYSLDSEVASVRPDMVVERTYRQQELADLINNADHVEARTKMLSFVRAQILWNEYKLDPAWMLHLMEFYQAPLDWRMVFPHGLYWITYGLKQCEGIDADDFYAINTERIAMFCLRQLCWGGRLIYEENPADPQEPRLIFLSDLRYLVPTHEEYLRAIEELMEATKDDGEEAQDWDTSTFRNGHISYLQAAISTLYVGGKTDQAEQLHGWMVKTYFQRNPEGRRNVEESVKVWLNEPGRLMPEVARSQLDASLQSAMVALARRQPDRFRRSYDYALNKIYNTYQERANDQIEFQESFEMHLAYLAKILLSRPKTLGEDLDLAERSDLYISLEGVLPGIQAALYGSIAPGLRSECKVEGIDFKKAFPAPQRVPVPR